MLFDNVKKAVAGKVGRALLTGKIYSPEIYLAGGLLAGAASVVMLARAHKRSEEVLGPTIDEIEYNKELIAEENMAAVEKTGHEAISVVEAQKKLQPMYSALILDAVKLYAPGVLLGAGSVALILASHGVLKGRNKALVSSVALLQQGWAAYRARVVEDVGAEKDEEYLYGANVHTVVSIEDGEDGKTRKVKRHRLSIPELSPQQVYGRTFDKYNSTRWQPDRGRNEAWLRMMQSQMNDELTLYGVVFLNDVYAKLGFKKTAVGAVSGWVKDSPYGDDRVLFGLDKSINQNEGDNRWVLDFNVQGYILEEVGNEAAPEVY